MLAVTCFLPLFCMEYAALGYGEMTGDLPAEGLPPDRRVCSDPNRHSCLLASSLRLRGAWKTAQAAESDHEKQT